VRGRKFCTRHRGRGPHHVITNAHDPAFPRPQDHRPDGLAALRPAFHRAAGGGSGRDRGEFTVVLKLAKGDYLFREGEPSRGCYLVQSGAVNVHRVNAAGKEQVIHVFRAGESFAEASLASLTGYPAHARASETGTVLLIPKVPILDLIGRRPDLALRMLGSMSATCACSWACSTT